MGQKSRTLADFERDIVAAVAAPAQLRPETTPMVSLSTGKPATAAGPLQVTVTLGRNVIGANYPSLVRPGLAESDYAVPMTRGKWLEFQTRVLDLLRILPGGDQGHAEVFGPFEGTGRWDGVDEDSAVITALLTHPDAIALSDALGTILAVIARDYGQDAIAYAVGPAHLARS